MQTPALEKASLWMVPVDSNPPQPIDSNPPQPIEQVHLIEARIPEHAQSQSPNLVPFLQKFGEVLSIDPLSQCPIATAESFTIVLLSRVPFSTICQSISNDSSVNEVKLNLASTQLDVHRLEIKTLPEGCSEEALRTLISPHTSCTVVITPSASSSIKSSSAILMYDFKKETYFIVDTW
ncbi:hypothetical protein BLNAU_15676 [Blattamonas nauphoetae]|uniref:Uncharacterized protein n=1 Tax=Blattamonas nauphoetae TaxID=2049346 RepID=A0ABQ9XDT5_9EUKA|nr:hypothetical protein BLNAU_15676 [Blattamonas nauphoetae]